eukprot:m.21457 g.21457  ORF g.21457 m.21457 type:complete len:463 (+) comp11145_c0_seq1:114-1502(+)
MAMTYSQADLDDEANTSHAKATWLHMDAEELRNLLVTLQNENSRLKYELKDSEAEVELTQKQLARFQTDQGRVDSRMKMVGDQLNTRDSGNLKAFVEASSSRVKMAEETRHYMEGEVSRLKAALREEQLTRLETSLQLEASDHELQGYKKEVESLKIERQSLRALIADLEAQLDEYDAVGGADSSRYIELLHQRDTTITELQQHLQDSGSRERAAPAGAGVDQQEYQRVVQNLSQLTREMQAASAAQSRMQDELDSVVMSAQQRQSQSQATIADLNAQLQRKDAEIAQLKAQLQQAELSLRQAYAEAVYAAPTQLAQPVQTSERAVKVDDATTHLSQQMTQSRQHIAVPNMAGWVQPQAIPMGPHGSYYFPVNVQRSKLADRNGIQGPHWLRLAQEGMALLDQNSWEPKVTVPVRHIRRYGKDDGVLAFESGRSAQCGQGVFYLATIHMEDIFDILNRYTGS